MWHKLEQPKLLQLADSSPEIFPVIVFVLMGRNWAFPARGQVLRAKPPNRKLSLLSDIMPLVFLPEEPPSDTTVLAQIVRVVQVNQQSQCQRILRLPHEFQRRSFIRCSRHKLIR